MELSQIKCLVAVASCRDYAAAAAELGLSPASLATQIARLEAEFGVRLLEKSGDALVLTLAGEEFLQYAEEICEKEQLLRQALQRHRRPVSQMIRVGVLSGVQFLGFAHSLASFLKKFPQIGFDIHEAGNKELIEMLRNREIDVAFAINPPEDNGLLLHRLYDDELVLVAPLGHPLASRKKIDLSDLDGETLLFSESDTMYEDFTKVLESLDSPIGVKFYLTHNTGILNNVGLVACGFGVTVLTRHVAEGCQHIDFAKIRIAPKIPRTFCLVSTQDSENKPGVKNFIEDILGAFGEK